MSAAEMTPEQRLAQLRAAKAERERARAAEKLAAELQGAELEERFEGEIGRIGVDFAMVDATAFGHGWIVVKLGEDLLFRKYVDAVVSSEGGVDAADLYDFVAPNVVYPSQEEYAAIVRKRGMLANRCAEALGILHGAKAKKTEGKF